MDKRRARIFAVNVIITRASSFKSEAILDRVYTVKALTEDSRSSLTEESNATTHLHTSKTSLGRFLADYRGSVKRSRPRLYRIV